jgi:hypothetical protein
VLYRPRNRSQTDRRTDEQTDGRHNDFSRAHFLKMCSKNIENFQNYVKKSDFDQPSWVNPPFFAFLTKI